MIYFPCRRDLYIADGHKLTISLMLAKLYKYSQRANYVGAGT